MQSLTVSCPECSSNSLYRDGLRHLASGKTVQRWLCRNCGYRFSEKPLNSLSDKTKDSKYAVKKPKNLLKALVLTETIGKTSSGLAGVTRKGKILEFLWYLKKQGLQENSLKTYDTYLNWLRNGGANLNDPESVKEVLANKKCSPNTKALAIAVYTKFLEFLERSWKPPKCKRTRKLPFIPLEKEIDALISGARKKLATFLELLKETGLRSGEAWNLKWIDIDFTTRTITFNEPKKYGNPRILKISPTLIAMLKAMQTENDRIFTGRLNIFRQSYLRYRKNLSFKIKNPRLLRITFHTFRHWKATMEYHKTKDILHVKELLGHRNINTTMLYTQLVDFRSDEYHTATAKTVEEARKLAEAGFEYFDTLEKVHIYRKRK